MRKLFYYISRIFFSKEKLLLIQLLNVIQDTLIRKSDGSVTMMAASGMCNYIHLITNKTKDIKLLNSLLYDNAPENFDDWGLYFFPPYQYEPRYEFLKELIKKY